MNYGFIEPKHILEKTEKICETIVYGLRGTAAEMIVEGRVE